MNKHDEMIDIEDDVDYDDESLDAEIGVMDMDDIIRDFYIIKQRMNDDA